MRIAYLICAAGRGTRTQEISAEIPKPLLRIKGKTLLEYAVDSLPLKSGDQVVVIGQEADQLNRMEDFFAQRYPQCEWRWLGLKAFTAGQLETAALGLDVIAPDAAVAIFNADSSFSSREFREVLEDVTWEGVIPCSREKGEAWSFCTVEENESGGALRIRNIAEKQRISEWCSVGFYFFRHQELFRQLVAEELATPIQDERYVSYLYHRYLQRSYSLLMLPVENFKAMGSVQQIADYWGLSVEEMQQEQQGF